MASTAAYHDRDGFIWYDGKLVPWREASLHILTHAMHYASAVFEGERAYNGHIFKLNEHSRRLLRSAEILDFKLPYAAAEIDQACNDTLKANKLSNGYVRPIAWRGSEMMGVSAQSTKIHLAVAAWDWGSYFKPEERMQGIRLAWAKYRRPDPRTAPTASKAAGLYMICTISKHEAERRGFADALMLDYRGQLAEATGANLFLVQNGELHTPTPDCFLDGITRRTVIGLARARQMKVVERALMPEELSKTQEVFLTGSAAEITPVREVGDGEYRFTPGRVTKQLIDDFTALTQEPAKWSSPAQAAE